MRRQDHAGFGRAPPMRPSVPAVAGSRRNARGGRLAAACGDAVSLRTTILAVVLLSSLTTFATARVLDDKDLERVAEIKASFTKTAMDIAQVARRPDLSSGDAECANAALRELVQISDELSSYEYLITIESQIGDFGDDNAMKSILRFAVDKAIGILETQRKRLNQLVEQCSRFPLSSGKTQQAVQFIEGTATVLKSIRPRL